MRSAGDMKGMGAYGTLGLEIVLSILFGLFLGMKLDDWLGTKPYLTVVWFGFGCAAAGRAIYRAWKRMQIEAKREEAEKGNPLQEFPDEKQIAWQREEAKREREAKDALEKGKSGAKTESPAESPDE